MRRSRLYSTVLIACLIGYGWLSYLLFAPQDSHEPAVCLIKEVTHLPCPSCGASRSVMAILEGHFSEALMWNPIGYVLSLILLLSPVWISTDLIFRKNTFFLFYHKIESLFRVKWFSFIMIGLMMANWIWNIVKHL